MSIASHLRGWLTKDDSVDEHVRERRRAKAKSYPSNTRELHKRTSVHANLPKSCRLITRSWEDEVWPRSTSEARGCTPARLKPRARDICTAGRPFPIVELAGTQCNSRRESTMRCEALFPALALLLSFGDALRFPVPEATPCVANEVDPWGWTPRITSAPDAFGLQRRQGSLTQTCAWYGDQGLVCSGPNFCIYLYSQPYMGCCPVDSNGNFTSCWVATNCVNQQQSSTECNLEGCSASWGVWYDLSLSMVRENCTDPRCCLVGDRANTQNVLPMS